MSVLRPKNILVQIFFDLKPGNRVIVDGKQYKVVSIKGTKGIIERVNSLGYPLNEKLNIAIKKMMGGYAWIYYNYGNYHIRPGMLLYDGGPEINSFTLDIHLKYKTKSSKRIPELNMMVLISLRMENDEREYKMEYVITDIDPSGNKILVNLIPEFNEFDQFDRIFPDKLILTKENIKNSNIFSAGEEVVNYLWKSDYFSSPKYYYSITIGGFR